jgi:hypothetical protein
VGQASGKQLGEGINEEKTGGEWEGNCFFSWNSLSSCLVPPHIPVVRQCCDVANVLPAAVGVTRLSLLPLVRRDMASRCHRRGPSTGEGLGARNGDKGLPVS